MKHGFFLSSLLLCLGCPPPPPVVYNPPKYAHVSLLGVIVGPAKKDNTQWDGPGKVPPEVFSDLSALLGTILKAAGKPGAAGVAKLASFFASPAIASLAKPDVEGAVTVYLNGMLDDRLVEFFLPKIQDSFTPDWPGADWDRVPIAEARIRVQLTDSDPINDDPIGIVEIQSVDLINAAQAGNVYLVPVTEQSVNQVLFVKISVIPQSD
jgi:hypothetical protein